MVEEMIVLDVPSVQLVPVKIQFVPMPCPVNRKVKSLHFLADMSQVCSIFEKTQSSIYVIDVDPLVQSARVHKMSHDTAQLIDPDGDHGQRIRLVTHSSRCILRVYQSHPELGFDTYMFLSRYYNKPFRVVDRRESVDEYKELKKKGWRKNNRGNLYVLERVVLEFGD